MLSSVKSPCYVTQRKKSSTNKTFGQDESRIRLPLREHSANEINEIRPLSNSTMKSGKDFNLSSASNSSIRTIKSATDFDLSSESAYNLLGSSSTSINNSSLKRPQHSSRYSISDRSHINSSRQLSTNSSRNLSHNASSLRDVSSRSRSYLGSDSYGNISQGDRSQYLSTSSLVPTQNSIRDLSHTSNPNNTTYIKSNSSTLVPSIRKPSENMESSSYKSRPSAVKCTVTETRRKIVVNNASLQMFQNSESGPFSDINSIVGAAVKNGNARVSVEYTKEQRKYIIQ